MNTSGEVRLVGIDADWEKDKVKTRLKKLAMINVIIVNLNCLNNFRNFTEIFTNFKELMEKSEFFKILYSEGEDNIKNLSSSVDWQGRKDIIYAGKKLEFNEYVIRSYWSWRFDSLIIHPLLNLRGEEI